VCWVGLLGRARCELELRTFTWGCTCPWYAATPDALVRQRGPEAKGAEGKEGKRRSLRCSITHVGVACSGLIVIDSACVAVLGAASAPPSQHDELCGLQRWIQAVGLRCALGESLPPRDGEPSGWRWPGKAGVANRRRSNPLPPASTSSASAAVEAAVKKKAPRLWHAQVWVSLLR
jgi:hypothetical protein